MEKEPEIRADSSVLTTLKRLLDYQITFRLFWGEEAPKSASQDFTTVQHVLGYRKSHPRISGQAF